MTNETDLRPATPEEITTTLAFALRFSGRKLIHDSDDFMAQVAAERLVRHLEASGFVLMKRPPARARPRPRVCRRPLADWREKRPGKAPLQPRPRDAATAFGETVPSRDYEIKLRLRSKNNIDVTLFAGRLVHGDRRQ